MAGVSDSDEIDSDNDDRVEVGDGGMSYSHEQEELKASFKFAAELEEGGGALLVPRLKTQEEKVRCGCGCFFCDVILHYMASLVRRGARVFTMAERGRSRVG